MPPTRSSATCEGSEPFEDAASAWFWTVGALTARREGARTRSGSRAVRPCEPDDVIRVLARLHETGRISSSHARVLSIWGRRGLAPDDRLTKDRDQRRLWLEALDALDASLRAKGIVHPRFRKKVLTPRLG